MTNESAINR